MSLSKNYQQMAQYNLWMTQKIYDALDEMSDEERKADRKAFWKSIHSTMNHILWADIRWTNRLSQSEYPIEVGQMGVDLFENFEELKAEHFKMAEYIENWVGTLNDEFFNQEISWVPIWGGDPIAIPYYVGMSHMFNHQTHHRGQVTQILNQLGINVGDTDLALMPMI